MERNLINDLTEGIGVLGQLRKYQEEIQEIEQILGKALGYPWFKDDPKNFPTATEADGVCVGVETAWSLAMIAADKIKELQGELFYQNQKIANVVDDLLKLQTNER